MSHVWVSVVKFFFLFFFEEGWTRPAKRANPRSKGIKITLGKCLDRHSPKQPKLLGAKGHRTLFNEPSSFAKFSFLSPREISSHYGIQYFVCFFFVVVFIFSSNRVTLRFAEEQLQLANEFTQLSHVN